MRFFKGVSWRACCTLGLIVCLAPAEAANKTDLIERTASDGAQLRFDPARNLYEFRAADGVSMLALWLPPSTRPVRGLFINGNPGGVGGDNRQFTRDRTFRAFAARMDFGLMGLHSMPGNQIKEKLAARIFKALEEFADFGVHPELAHLPFVSLGNSNGGATSYNLVMHAPTRAIAFAMNVGRMSVEPPDAALEVPGFIVIGPQDNLRGDNLTEAQRVDPVRAQVAAARRRGARWAWLAEQNKGHEVGRIFDYQMVFFERMVAARLPALTAPQGDPRRGPVELIKLPLKSGWLADDLAWRSGIVPIAPHEEFGGDRQIASWVADEALAILYRGLATYDSPITVGFENLGPIVNENASGRFLTEVGGHLLAPGKPLQLEINLTKFADWQTLIVFDGEKVVAHRARKEQTDPLRLRVPLRASTTPGAHAFTVLATNARGQSRTAIPVHVVVEDSKQKTAAPAYEVPMARLQAIEPLPAGEAPSAFALQAVALQPQDAKKLQTGGVRAAEWARVRARAEPSFLAAPEDVVGEAKDSRAKVAVWAAHDEAGLHLFFELEDDVAVAASDKDDLASFDAISVLLSRHAPGAIWKSQPAEMFVNAGWSITRDATEIQSPFGAGSPPRNLRFGWAAPWEWQARVLPRQELQRRRGIVITTSSTGTQRQQAWFVPWKAVGAEGFAPAPGARFGLALGFNDLDDAQKPQNIVRLRPGRRSPWYEAWTAGAAPLWGQVTLLPPTQALVR